MTISVRSLLLLVTVSSCALQTLSLRHTFHIEDSPALVGPIGEPFGFLAGGSFRLDVKDFKMRSTSSSVSVNKVEGGFFLQKYENEAQFHQHMEVLREKQSCAYSYFQDSFDDVLPADEQGKGEIPNAEQGIPLLMKELQVEEGKATMSVSYRFKKGEAGLYFLIYQVCPYDEHIKSTFNLEFHFMNVDTFGNPSYLSAGELKLPWIFFFFSLSYLILLIAWVMNNREIAKGRPGLFETTGQPIVYPIHHVMSALVLFKFLATFFESIRYHVIQVSGHAEVWSVLYYVFTFVRGTFLFTVILLIGTGWSFVKPFLNDREKKIVMVVLIFQVVNNLAMVILSQLTEGELRYDRWTAILHLVDILCCCAVLIPIVWQVNALEKSMGESEDAQDEEALERELESGDKGQILSKLRLFRSFYLLVVAYIYSTRILVYLFATMLSYEMEWLRYFIIELVTLTFYVTVGCMFRPMVETPYVAVRGSDDAREEVVEMMPKGRRDD